MSKFPVDVPLNRVLRALHHLGFLEVRRGNHIAFIRNNPDGSKTPMTLPNHSRIKGSTLHTALAQADVSREDFLRVFEGL